MNRLIIIGNGFDLAHGLPTSYKDFIDDYWKSVAGQFDEENYKSTYPDDFIEVNYSIMSMYFEQAKGRIKEVRTYVDFKNFINEYKIGTKNNPYQYGDENACELVFKNIFFEIICEKSIENWVDVENVYYEILKKRAKGNFIKSGYPSGVKQLNDDFETVKLLLEKYLNEKVEKHYEMNENIDEKKEWKYFYEILRPISISNNEILLEFEFNQKEDVSEIKNFFELEKLHGKEKNKKKSCILSFNYTSTLDKYVMTLHNEKFEVELNQIHGRINKKRNRLNFGFGDEMDEDYKMIENMNNNQYLRNFKSFQYLQNKNYSDLLSFVNYEKFQVLIMGHSCGLSDRTLLNTIFEHENCRSIKIFFHEIKDEKGNVIKDNYTELIQNISRHFNDKKLMREKIVNKTLCKPLPQIQLPKKE